MIDRWSRAAEVLRAKIAAASGTPNSKSNSTLGASQSITAPEKNASGISTNTNANHNAPTGPLEIALPRFTQALCEDLNMARAIAALNEAVAVEDNSSCAHRELEALLKMDSVLGVLERNTQVANSGDADFEAKVNALIEVRAAARRNKDFAASDRARDELVSLGVQIKDGATGTTWTRTVRA